MLSVKYIFNCVYCVFSFFLLAIESQIECWEAESVFVTITVQKHFLQHPVFFTEFKKLSQWRANFFGVQVECFAIICHQIVQ